MISIIQLGTKPYEIVIPRLTRDPVLSKNIITYALHGDDYSSYHADVHVLYDRDCDHDHVYNLENAHAHLLSGRDHVLCNSAHHAHA